MTSVFNLGFLALRHHTCFNKRRHAINRLSARLLTCPDSYVRYRSSVTPVIVTVSHCVPSHTRERGSALYYSPQLTSSRHLSSPRLPPAWRNFGPLGVKSFISRTLPSCERDCSSVKGFFRRLICFTARCESSRERK
jgi:hypothetical protein